MFDFSRLVLAHGCDTLIDVGANEGQFVFPAIEALRPRRVIAVEMLPDVAIQLRNDPRLQIPNCTVLSCAVGAGSGRLPCLRSIFSQASSLLHINAAANGWYGMDLDQHEDGTVEVRTLDQICAEAGIESIDVLKIDVQGYESEVIRGAELTIARTRNLIIEVEFLPVYHGQMLAHQIDEQLVRRGFAYRENLAEFRAADGTLLHADALYVR